MSKMSQLHAELTQEAYENGYESLSDYLADKVLENAHEHYLKEKSIVLGDLRNILIGYSAAGKSDSTEYGVIEHAIKFIEQGEM